MRRVFVGRSEIFNQIKGWLMQEQGSQVRVISVEGAGGVGKTTLINEVLLSLNLKQSGFLCLDLRGEDFLGKEAPHDPVTVLSAVANRAREQLPRDNQPYFALTMNLKKANDELEADLEKRLSELGEKLSEHGKTAGRLFIRSGRALGEYIPRVKDYIDFEKLDKIDQQTIDEFIEHAKKLWELGGGVFGTLRKFFSTHARNQDRLVRDASRAMSEDFYSDLQAIICGYKAKDLAKLMPNKVTGINKLCFFIDDYESMQNDFGRHFLVRGLLPRLQEGPFKTTLIVSGRDDLAGTDPSWNRRVGQELREHTVRLEPLDRDHIKEMLEANMLDGDLDELSEKILEDTDGYPFLVETVIEEGGREDISVLSLKKFYDRQTHWMSPTQRRWLEHLCFLDQINMETIPRVLPDGDAKEVHEWFRQEGSIRDVNSSVWLVRPFVRTRVLKYFQSIDPAEFRKLEEAAQPDERT